jgi:hypothetical protein
MNIIELIIDENDEFSGIDAISIVEAPAIEEHFVALNDHKEYKFAEVSKDQQILIGPMLIPNKPIYRREGDKEFYIYFTKDTVRKASELFLMKGKQNNSTYEHFEKLNGLSMVESWIVEDSEKDKSAFYGMTLPVGTWAGTIKVNNTEIWEQFVKTGKVKGFSIEGYFAEKGERPNEQIEEELSAAYKLLEIKQALIEYQLQSYSNYPSGVKNNAKRGIELNENQGNKCATQTGKVRAQQLAQGKAISLDTIKRMYSYLSRAEEYYDPNDTTACGTISYLLWGGKAGLRWSRSILKELGEIDLVEKEILKAPCWDGYEMIGYKMKNGRRVPNCVPLSRKELKVGEPHYTADGKLWTGPTHKNADGRLMTGETHTEDSEYLYHKSEIDNLELKEPCWDGYEMIGFKTKNGKRVPNCVPITRK